MPGRTGNALYLLSLPSSSSLHGRDPQAGSPGNNVRRWRKRRTSGNSHRENGLSRRRDLSRSAPIRVQNGCSFRRIVRQDHLGLVISSQHELPMHEAVPQLPRFTVARLLSRIHSWCSDSASFSHRMHAAFVRLSSPVANNLRDSILGNKSRCTARGGCCGTEWTRCDARRGCGATSRETRVSRVVGRHSLYLVLWEKSLRRSA
jgi:hypothetical protein